MTLALDLQTLSAKTSSIERAVLEALAYSDIFDYPLRLNELHGYLPVRAEEGELLGALESLNGRLGQKDGFRFLAGREEIVEIRKRREARSQQLLPIALTYGRILGSLPFIRMVALTGSLAVMNLSKNADFDYMLVAAPRRVWTARLFALALNRAANLFGHTLCPNLIVSETALEWSLHDLYSARELCQMIPITGLDVYHRLMEANGWTKEFLPNANRSLPLQSAAGFRGRQSMAAQSPSPLWRLLRRSLRLLLEMTEWVLRGRLGDWLEAWEMTRKIARFSKQAGFGEETVFTDEVCQGNFHHHRKRTRDAFEQKLNVVARRALPDEAISSSKGKIDSLPMVARNDEGIS